MYAALDKALALRTAPLFASLPTADLLPVANLCTEISLDAGDVLFREGDMGDAMYVVVRGNVTVERDGEILATLGCGECVGEMAALDWLPRSATVAAAEPSTLFRLDRHDLLDLLIDHPILAENLATVMAARVRRSNRA
ncbi:MAG: cyclic nucleotide-binding domain-containing protein [Proteobacteria bacterium]|nr:cyclic nucleotide-binding domain-containing protein [Pseudomonadota bacterium]